MLHTRAYTIFYSFFLLQQEVDVVGSVVLHGLTYTREQTKNVVHKSYLYKWGFPYSLLLWAVLHSAIRGYGTWNLLASLHAEEGTSPEKVVERHFYWLTAGLQTSRALCLAPRGPSDPLSCLPHTASLPLFDMKDD